jgi:hypothetical protein
MKIDLSLLPKLEYAHAWFTLDERLTERVGKLHRAAERLQNSIKFMWFSDSSNEIARCAAAEMERLRSGFLRAALAELVSTEEIIRLDLADLGRSDPVLKMNDTPLPHLHFVRELRHHELHLCHSRLSEFSRDLLWGDASKPSDAKPLTVSMWTLEGITSKSFGELRSVKKYGLYSAVEISAMVDWFNANQARWGVHEILLRVVTGYAEALSDMYFP